MKEWTKYQTFGMVAAAIALCILMLQIGAPLCCCMQFVDFPVLFSIWFFPIPVKRRAIVWRAV